MEGERGDGNFKTKQLKASKAFIDNYNSCILIKNKDV